MKTKFLILLLLLLAAVSCSRHSQVSDTLARAEAVMEEHPDSALCILESIPDSAIVTSRDRALHVLLLTQALDKNYIDVTSDSLINIAVEYFHDHNDRYEMLSHYYKGIVEYNSQNYRNGVVSFLIGLDFAEKLNDTLYIARNNEKLADLYNLNYDFQNEIKTRKKAVEAYKTCGKDKNVAYALLDLSIALQNDQKYTEALDILKGISVDSYKQDITLKRFYLKSLADTYLNLQEKEDALYYTRKLLDLLDKNNLTKEEYTLVIDVCIENDMPDSARIYANAAQSTFPHIDSYINMQSSLLNLYVDTKDSAKIIELYDSVLVSQNKEIQEILRRQVSQGGYDYYNIKSKEDKRHIAKARIRTKIWAIGSVLLLLTVIAVILYSKEKTKRNRLELEMAVSSLEKIKNSLYAKASQLENLETCHRKDVRELIKDRFKFIDSFSSFYGTDNSKPIKTELLLSHVNRFLSEFNNPEFIQSLEDILNRYHNNIMSKFKALFPDISPQQYRHVLYIFLGFSASTISIFLHTSKSNVYTYRSKLKRMVLDKGVQVPIEIRQYFMD